VPTVNLLINRLQIEWRKRSFSVWKWARNAFYPLPNLSKHNHCFENQLSMHWRYQMKYFKNLPGRGAYQIGFISPAMEFGFLWNIIVSSSHCKYVCKCPYHWHRK
jgi:hypothetical protein